jgi:saccharopine dehydrogenase-like NADP-dependent oxidoreductase
MVKGGTVMKIIVLGGAGAVGEKAAFDLGGMKGVKEVCIADSSLNGARLVAETIGKNATAKAADINDEKALIELIRDYQVVVNCVGPFYKTVPKVLEACIKAKVHYVDVCDDYDATKTLLGYHDQCVKAGITGIVSFGASPGFTNMCGLLGSQKMEAEEIHTSWVENIIDVGGGFATLWHGIHMANGDVPQFLDGQWVTVPGLSGCEEFEFLEPLGKYPVYFLGHSEPMTMPLYIKGLKTVTNRGNMWPFDSDLIKEMKPALDIGLGSTDAIEVNGRDIVIREFTVQLILQKLMPESMDTMEPDDSMHFMIRVDVKGKINGEQAHYIYRAHMDTNEATGGSAAYGAHAIAAGKITAKGCFGPEGCVDPNDYFRHFEEYKGIKLIETRTVTGKAQCK